MRVALVYDRVNKWGGAERVLLALHKIWPDAPLYTAVYDPPSARWAEVFDVRPSFLNHIPWVRRHHELLPVLTPLAFESFDFDGYDVVISVTSAEAKSVITKPGTLHVCYCLTPTRYLWSGADEYTKRSSGIFGAIGPMVLRAFLPALRRWDIYSSKRPDYFIAISDIVRTRIREFYGREDVHVVYPPVWVKTFSDTAPGSYFLTVGRMVPYKRLDIVVDAFTQLGWPLVLIGTGSELSDLKRRAGPTVRIISAHLTDAELAHYYKHCRAFVFAGLEDFGITALEAASAGKPVITYRKSGMAETVVEGKTGALFDVQSVDSLVQTLKKFTDSEYSADNCRANAVQYDIAHFTRAFSETILQLYARRKEYV